MCDSGNCALSCLDYPAVDKASVVRENMGDEEEKSRKKELKRKILEQLILHKEIDLRGNTNVDISVLVAFVPRDLESEEDLDWEEYESDFVRLGPDHVEILTEDRGDPEVKVFPFSLYRVDFIVNVF